jgi:Mg/Co/Ni transporter MgtE
VTNREKLHHFVDELSEDEAAAALARLRHERETVQRWAQAEDSSVEDTWALANAREAVREEPWWHAARSAG